MNTFARADVAGRSALDRILSPGRAIAATIQGRWSRYKTYRQLIRLDDRLLADMGLNRHQIEAWYRD